MEYPWLPDTDIDAAALRPRALGARALAGARVDLERSTFEYLREVQSLIFDDDCELSDERGSSS